MSAPLGATPAQWQAWLKLGLLPDLLPVVADPSVPVSPDSKIADVGKVPSRVNGSGHAVGIPKWTQHRTTAAQVAAWNQDPRLGVCIVCRQVKAIDIDVPDRDLAAHVREIMELTLGVQLPARGRANSGKCLLLVRCAEPTARWRFTLPEDLGLVELLGESQQFIASSTHPSGARYEWEGGAVPAELPEVSLAELHGAMQAAAQALGCADSMTRGRAALAGATPRRRADSEDHALVDYLWEHGWVRTEHADGVLDVRCPWQDQHTDGAAGSDSSTTFYPAGVGSERRGFKCLHAHCEARTNFDFVRAVGFEALEVASEFEVVPVVQAPPKTRGVYQPLPFVSEVPLPNWDKDKAGRVVPSSTSIAEALARPDVCGARIAYDEFKAQPLIEWHHAQGAWRPVTDTDNYELCVQLERRGFKMPSDKLVERAINYVADQNRFDSARDWLNGLQWDGVPRVERFFVDCWGAADTPYSRAVARYTWTALAGRVMHPGCKADMVPVLVGGQGVRKTSGVMAMCPTDDAFVELDFSIGDKELAYKIRGKLIAELGEMRGVSGREAEANKQWISRPFEEWREVFMKRPTRFYRRLLVIGTGNREGILEDETGNRRWLPMAVSQVDDARILRERDQLWAEGRALFCANGHTPEWEAAQTLAGAEHADFKVEDVWEDVIAAWLETDAMDQTDGVRRGDQPFRTVDVLVGALGCRPDAVKRADQLRAAKALSNLGFSAKAMRIDGKVVKRWVRKN